MTFYDSATANLKTAFEKLVFQSCPTRPTCLTCLTCPTRPTCPTFPQKQKE